MSDIETQPRDHDVLAERIKHFASFDAEYRREKWELFDYSRQHCPVAKTDAEGGFYIVTRYEDVRHVLEDWQTFSSAESPVIPTGIPTICPIDVDPPMQTGLRRILNPLFARSAVTKYIPEMRAVASDLVDRFVERGEVEILTEYSGPYIGNVLTKIVFEQMAPAELKHAQDVADQISKAASPDLFRQLYEIASEYLNRATSDGVQEDSVVAHLLAGEIDGRPLTHDEKVGCLCILILGGLNTTRAAVGNITYRMSQDPDLESRLRDPQWTRRDLDEFLRLDSPVGTMARVATRDVEINGTLVKKGERVQVRFDSANRDPEVFENPEQLDFDEIRQGHAAFGMGVHRCLGSNLARLQIEIAFEELLKKVRNIRLAPQAEIEWAPGNSNQLHAVHIQFDRMEDE